MDRSSASNFQLRMWFGAGASGAKAEKAKAAAAAQAPRRRGSAGDGDVVADVSSADSTPTEQQVAPTVGTAQPETVHSAGDDAVDIAQLREIVRKLEADVAVRDEHIARLVKVMDANEEQLRTLRAALDSEQTAAVSAAETHARHVSDITARLMEAEQANDSVRGMGQSQLAAAQREASTLRSEVERLRADVTAARAGAAQRVQDEREAAAKEFALEREALKWDRDALERKAQDALRQLRESREQEQRAEAQLRQLLCGKPLWRDPAVTGPVRGLHDAVMRTLRQLQRAVPTYQTLILADPVRSLVDDGETDWRRVVEQDSRVLSVCADQLRRDHEVVRLVATSAWHRLSQALRIGTLRDERSRQRRRSAAAVAAEPPVQRPQVSEEMLAAHLSAGRAYWNRRVDNLRAERARRRRAFQLKGFYDAVGLDVPAAERRRRRQSVATGGARQRLRGMLVKLTEVVEQACQAATAQPEEDTAAADAHDGDWQDQLMSTLSEAVSSDNESEQNAQKNSPRPSLSLHDSWHKERRPAPLQTQQLSGDNSPSVVLSPAPRGAALGSGFDRPRSAGSPLSRNSLVSPASSSPRSGVAGTRASPLPSVSRRTSVTGSPRRSSSAVRRSSVSSSSPSRRRSRLQQDLRNSREPP